MGTVQGDIGQQDLGRVARPRWVRFGIACLLIVCVFFVIYGSLFIWRSLVFLPRTYDRLGDHGAKATARFVGCPRSHGSCELRLTFAGETRSWRYGENRSQFSGLNPGAPVAMLVDPSHSATAYTVVDVARRTNAGWSAPAIYGFVLLLIGFGGGYVLTRMALAVRRTYLPDGRLRRPKS